jgi:hypothetical protein
MASADDYTLLIFGILGTLVITIVGSLILRHLNIIGKTKDASTITTINVGGLQEDFKDFKKSMADDREHLNLKLDGIFNLIEKKDDTFRSELRRLDERHTTTEKTLIEINYRLKSLETKV